MPRRTFVLAMTLLVAGSMAVAHELEENRATLVLREPNHLALTLYLSYPDVLHRALAPERPFAEFLVAASAVSVEELERQLRRVQKGFEAGTRLELEPGAELEAANWVWPAAAQVQAMLRERVMETVTSGGGHRHAAPVEIRAEWKTERPVSGARVRFPAEFRRVLVVAYRPVQAWAEPAAFSPRFPF